jgi:AcrR family transcriptional regulator
MKPSARLRHPAEGGYPRGEETRLRIIEAAIGLFGENGFNGASTREIASRAGVNAPALQYYFENKEGVYAACAEHIAMRAWARFEPAVTRAATALADGKATSSTLIDAFCFIQESIADHLLGSTEAQSWRMFVSREQGGHGNSCGFEIIYSGVSTRIFDVGSGLVSRITGLPKDDPLTLIRMMTLQGQLMYFHAGRRTALAALRWDEITSERLELLKATVRQQTRTLFESWIPPSQKR